ncbi:MAG TPA: hypothetical protein VNW49_00285 [Puia sp.]|nr:hypothetical protein [Puia sp.]
MKNSLRLFYCLIILTGCTQNPVHAQDLTGIWRGHFRSNELSERLTGNYDDRYKMEVQIAQTHNRFQAITYSYKSTEFYGKAEASGTLNVQTKKVLLKEGKLLEVRYASGSVCVMTCFLQYSRLGNDEYLQGTYFSTNADDSTTDCGKGSIFLHRVAETDFYKEPFLEKKEKELLARKKDAGPVKKSTATVPPVAASGETAKKSPPKTSPVKKTSVSPPVTVRSKSKGPEPVQGLNTRDSTIRITQPQIPVSIPEVLQTRTNELLKTLTVNHSDIELRIYDDGAIDNDTVSVYYDNKLIVSNARISDQPVTVHITVEPSDHPHRLVMVAENLGDIPPNTSLLVVNDGDKRYEERIISNEQKNIVINFVYKKIE